MCERMWYKFIVDLNYYFFFFHQCRAKPAGREGQERNHPLACSYTLNVFSERKRKTAVWLRNPGILYNQVKLAVKAKDVGQEGEHRKTGKPNWKEEAQSTELEKRGGEEVNRGRGEICVTAAAWGSPTEQRGMLLMDMSDIVLTSSLWILQQTHTHWILHACENIRHTDTSFQVCSCENPALTTILSKPFAHLFYVYICNPWLLRSIHVIIYSIEDLHFWKTDVCVCRQKMSFVTVRVELRQLVDSPTGWLTEN